MAETIRDNNASSPLPILPLEIIGEILTRLPVKSLMRFKCVCKSWRVLISEPCFALKHAETWEAMMAEDVPLGVRENKNRGHCQRLRQYGVITTSQYKLKSCCVQSLFNEKFAGVEVHDHQLLGRDYYHLVGTCHGLICFHTDHKHMHLWNPTLKLHSIWPGSFLETGSGESVTYGFGYDQSHGDYRVVALLHQRSQNMTEAKVYSAKHGRWRSTGMSFPSGIVAEKTRPGIYINGTLNWAAANLSSSSSTIVSYKLSHDVFEELPQPVCTKGCFMMTLGNLGGCLSMVCYCQRSNASVWVMKEFGEGESWVKLVSIPGLTEYARPLWISNEDEVLVEFRSGLGLYNCGNGMFKYPVADSLSSCRNVKVYVKTMVSPNAS